MPTLTAQPRSARIALLFVLLAGVPVVTLSWLGWRLLVQDQTLGQQQQREQLENAATLLTRALDARLQEIEQRLGEDAREVADMLPGAAVVAVTGGGVSGRAGLRLPFYPRVASDEISTAGFASAETVEFRERDLRRAANMYRALGESAEPRLRAAALVRQARALRQDQRSDEALAVYDTLAGLSGTWVAGAPAELVARRERAALLTLSGRADEAARERQALAGLLDSGRYPIDRATFEFFGASTGTTRSTDREALAMAVALEDSWPRWPLERSGRLAGTFDNQPLILVWRHTGPDASGGAVVAPAASVLSAMSGLAQNLPVSVRVEDATGAAAWGQTLPDGPRLSRLARESGLPWTVHVAPSDARGTEALTRRRQLFTSGLAFLVLAMAAAGFAIFRSVNRELTLARQQSDFVATVSHEFRTPLTAMAHLTELLEEGAGSPARLPEYYAALARETRRLRDLVEHVLDFGQLESGRRQYHMEVVDAREPVRQAVEAFAGRAGGSRVQLAPVITACSVRADRDAVALAIGTLVDNALKYSPATAPIGVSIAPRGDMVGISVEDHGPGIPRGEQRTLFRKFVRGSAARAGNVAGTGLGLAIADAIVRAHGGRLDVATAVGRGSCFTVLLPRV